MIPTIGISLLEKTDEKQEFEVILVGEHTTFHRVTLTLQYWKKIANGFCSPEKFVRDSIEFLLSREPQNSILPTFDVSVIATYFKEFEKIMTKRYDRKKQDLNDPTEVWHFIR